MLVLLQTRVRTWPPIRAVDVGPDIYLGLHERTFSVSRDNGAHSQRRWAPAAVPEAPDAGSR